MHPYKIRDGTKTSFFKGIRKHHTGKIIVDVCVNHKRVTKVFPTVEEAIIGRRLLLNNIKTLLENKKMNAVVNFTTDKGIIAQPSQSQTELDASLATFTFPLTGQNVRIIMREGQPWFVGKNICDVLGLANARQALSNLDEDEKITVQNSDGNPRKGVPHQLTLISESGLYALIFRSSKPAAKVFSKWVRAEVLPATRQRGGYMLPASPTESPEEIMARALIIAQHTITQQKEALTEAKPVVDMYARLTQGNTLWPMRLATQTLRVRLADIHKVCSKHHILRREQMNGLEQHRWWPTKKALELGLVEKGYFTSISALNYAFTVKGMEWLKEKLFIN